MKWYMQIVIGLIGTIVLTTIDYLSFDTGDFHTHAEVIRHTTSPAFYTVKVLNLAATVLLLVGVVRGLLVLIRKFRSFVRIGK